MPGRTGGKRKLRKKSFFADLVSNKTMIILRHGTALDLLSEGRKSVDFFLNLLYNSILQSELTDY